MFLNEVANLFTSNEKEDIQKFFETLVEMVQKINIEPIIEHILQSHISAINKLSGEPDKKWTKDEIMELIKILRNYQGTTNSNPLTEKIIAIFSVFFSKIYDRLEKENLFPVILSKIYSKMEDKKTEEQAQNIDPKAVTNIDEKVKSTTAEASEKATNFHENFDKKLEEIRAKDQAIKKAKEEARKAKKEKKIQKENQEKNKIPLQNTPPETIIEKTTS